MERVGVAANPQLFARLQHNLTLARRMDLPRFNGRVSDRHYAACCHCSSYSAGLMYPNVEWRRFRLYQVSM